MRELAPRVGGLDRDSLRASLLQLAERMAGLEVPGHGTAAIEAAIALGRQLYALSRSGEALLVTRAGLALAERGGEVIWRRRAATACGLLSADSGDLVGAIEYHVAALRLARQESEPIGVAAVWHNIGVLMGIAGHYELASRCYRRAIDEVAGLQEPSFSRFCSYANLADSHFQLGACEEGLEFASRALSELTPEFREQDLHGVVTLERSFVRLLVGLGRVEEARPHVAECVALAGRSGTARSAIASAITRAIHEQALGRSDLALTLLEGALARARLLPPALRDTLAAVIRAEEQAGHYERALLRMQELAEHIYRLAIDRARAHIELSHLPARGRTRLEYEQDQMEARLMAKVEERAPPAEWAALDRLALGATLRMDPTGWHGKRVGALVKALLLADGANPLQAVETGLAAELHDIGMASIPEAILGKAGPLNDAERRIVRRHTEAGAEILRDDRHPRVFVAREIATYHHARWDGNGYPNGVSANAIPFAARACAIAESYDAMVCGLGARPARTMDAALAELHREAGGQFDPRLVQCFDGMVREESRDLGLDLASRRPMSDFQALVSSLQEDRGFV